VLGALRVGIAGLVLALGVSAVPAAEVSVAVAANFTKVAEELAVAFKAATGDDLKLSFGATGALYAQITQGAPFEVFLAADHERPQRAVDEGLGVGGTAFTYAIGALVLYSPSVDVGDGVAVLNAGAFEHLAIADPDTAPYGAAAMEVMISLGVSEALKAKLVIGGNISQALQFVESGNAELGFVALSQAIGRTDGYQWLVPTGLYTPIRQDAVLLKTGEANPVARAFLDFLRSDDAVAVIEKAGYTVE
jgi:molybdate transport system substrate-binding protein